MPEIILGSHQAGVRLQVDRLPEIGDVIAVSWRDILGLMGEGGYLMVGYHYQIVSHHQSEEADIYGVRLAMHKREE